MVNPVSQGPHGKATDGGMWEQAGASLSALELSLWNQAENLVSLLEKIGAEMGPPKGFGGEGACLCFSGGKINMTMKEELEFALYRW